MKGDLDTYKEIFKLFDKNGDGLISLDEYITVLKIFNKDMKTDDKFLKHFTTNQMTFDDFLYELQNNTCEKIEECEIIKAFEIFDIDGDGLISINDYKTTMVKLGDTLTNAAIEETFIEMGVHPTDKITYDIFKKIVISIF
jgi:calmodulin